MSKRTMTLNLTDAEMEALEALAKEKELNKTAILRQALRLYQLMESKTVGGGKLLFEDKDKKQTELHIL